MNNTPIIEDLEEYLGGEEYIEIDEWIVPTSRPLSPLPLRPEDFPCPLISIEALQEMLNDQTVPPYEQENWWETEETYKDLLYRGLLDAHERWTQDEPLIDGRPLSYATRLETPSQRNQRLLTRVQTLYESAMIAELSDYYTIRQDINEAFKRGHTWETVQYNQGITERTLERALRTYHLFERFSWLIIHTRGIKVDDLMQLSYQDVYEVADFVNEECDYEEWNNRY